MIKNKGVYTTECPACSRSTIMHVLSDGSISPNKCTHCEMGFAGLENGLVRNTFVIVPASEKFSIFGNKEAEEKNKVEEKGKAGTSIKINKKTDSIHKKSEHKKIWGKNY